MPAPQHMFALEELYTGCLSPRCLGAISSAAGCLKAKSEWHTSCRKQGCFHPAESRANGILSRQPLGGLVRERHSPGQQSCCPSADQQEDALPLYLKLAGSCHVKTQASSPNRNVMSLMASCCAVTGLRNSLVPCTQGRAGCQGSRPGFYIRSQKLSFSATPA